MDDVRAVMDAVGSERAALFGDLRGRPDERSFFAATYPERMSALVLYGTLCKASLGEDYPWAFTRSSAEHVSKRSSGLGRPARLHPGRRPARVDDDVPRSVGPLSTATAAAAPARRVAICCG